MIALAVIGGVLALIPAALVWRNLRAYRPPPPALSEPVAVSVLIPARNEERSIGAAVEAALANTGVSLEVIVLDDHSTDATAGIVRGIAQRDGRVRLLPAPPLPPGWCGKQHACASLAQAACGPWLVFADADVRLAPGGLARMVAFMNGSGADLASGIPRQETVTFLEQLVIPLIHFVLLGFLPLDRMRQSGHPSYGAGCGQLFIAGKQAYEKAGGHAAIRASLHDGVTLPRAFRQAGLKTDLFDATDLATCRMYRSAGELWRGLSKNATEGLAAPAMILPVTVVLLGGQVLPVLLLPVSRVHLVAVALAYLTRLLLTRRFRQSWLGAALHPLGVAVLVAIQWYAFLRRVFGQPVAWKERVYDPQTA